MSIDKQQILGKHVHFVGIGGVSMSALAKLTLHLGGFVSGSDVSTRNFCAFLDYPQVTLYQGHNACHVDGAHFLVYTDAVSKNNPEIVAATAAKIPVLSRAEYLGALSRYYNDCVAVAGTHGKTTTTGMIGIILIHANKNPTIHIGGKLPQIANGLRMGGDDIFVTEACEYKRNFLKIPYTYGILLNMDSDHLDYYTGIEDIRSAFRSFYLANSCKSIIYNNDDLLLKAEREHMPHAISFGISSCCNYRAQHLHANRMGKYSFDVIEYGNFGCRVHLSVIGKHNVTNALAAIAFCRAYGIDWAPIQSGLTAFCGVDYRCQHVGSLKQAEIILDYAHHPKEIEATMEAVSQAKYRRLIAVFEPHTYTRLQALFPAFVTCFSHADLVIVSKVFAAREQPLVGVTGKKLSSALLSHGVHSKYIASYDKIADYLWNHLLADDLLIIIGAGDIHQVYELLSERCVAINGKK